LVIELPPLSEGGVKISLNSASSDSTLPSVGAAGAVACGVPDAEEL
jgi:hypothetical protein